MSRDFIGALLQLNAEKGVPREQLVRTVEDAIQSAYRRVAPGYEDVYVRLDTETGEMRIYRARVVVSEVEDETTEWSIAQAQEHDPGAKLGDLVEYEQLEPTHFGRVGAQVAGQVVRQRLREAERETLFDEFAHREGEIITGSVGRVEPSGVILDLGKAEAILRTTDQSATEHYRIGQHVKAYVLEVRRTTRGPLIYVSRTHKNFLRRLFELEVPEIQAGTVEIRAIAREAGSRSKMAVASRQDGLDPVGATVGQRGARVQAVVAELGGEKIDVVPWSDDPEVFVANALSPAQVVGVEIDEAERIASVTVPERMLSLAIGREGQNARLAAKLTGWRIDIRSETGTEADGAAAAAMPQTIAEPDEPERDEPPVVSATTADETAAVADTAAGEPTEVPK
ncbi:MAG: transcription termination factor NusA [Candidatus Limnocylindrales bacterium]|jgi:transcription termination/antitermination protein NusA